MPTLMLKLLALTGVISAGCFAVWKANTELQPVAPTTSTEFTTLEGEPDPKVGLGGQAISNAGAAVAADAESAADEAPIEDKTLALAGQPFPENVPAEAQVTPRGMPVEAPADEQVEPTASEEPEPVEPEPVEPMPGVTSLEHLEKSEKARAIEPTKALGATASPSPKINTKSLTGSGTPALIAISKNSAVVPSREPTPTQIVPVNAEEPTEVEPQLLAQASSEPTAPADFPTTESAQEIVPAADEAPATLPELNVPTPRTRPVPTPRNEESPTPVDDTNLFEQEVGDPQENTEPTPESEPTEVSPIDVPDENPSSISAPADTHSEGQSSPRSRSSVPRKPADSLLYGESTSEVPELAPSQQPQLRIEKKAQPQAEVGEVFVYEIIVQNIGQVTADKVVVEERIPNNCKMERSAPTATLSSDSILRWEVGEMAPGTNKTIKVEVLPLKAGPVGSVATVRFASMVSTKTIVTAPTLSLTIQSPKEAAVGEPVPVKFTLKNTGAGIARKVMLRTILKEGLSHPAGPDVSLEDLTLKPNETKELTLVVTPTSPGVYTPTVMVTASGVEQEDKSFKLNIIPAYLTLTRQGHAQRFVKRDAASTTRVTNNSSQPMKNVQVTEELPDGLEPVLAQLENASWNSKSRLVTWNIPAIGPREFIDIKMTVVSNREGTFQSRMAAVDALNRRAELDTQLEVKGFAALALDFQGDGNAVAAVGEQVSMQVTVRNKGSATAKGVQAVFEVPSQMTFVTAKGPSKFTQHGKFVTFAELPELNPEGLQTYDIVLIAAEEGSSKVAFELMSEDRPDAVRQEEPIEITPQ